MSVEETIREDTRKKRVKTVWGEATYREAARGLNIEVRRSMKIPSKEVRAIMVRTVDAYLAGKIEPFGGREVGHKNAQRRTHRYMFRTNGPKGGLVWRSAECELEKRYLSSVFFHTRDDACEEADWTTGEPVKPWITISACDGSGVRVHAVMDEGEVPVSVVETLEEQEENEVEEEESPKERKKRRKKERDRG